LAFLVAVVAFLITYVALKKKEKTKSQLIHQQFIDAPRVNRSVIINDTGTWRLSVTAQALQLVWTSDTTNVVWDSFNGTCGPNAASYAKLTNTSWFDSTNFVPRGLGFPASYSILASTPAFTDTMNLTHYGFNLVLYPGMLRIEQDGGDGGVWNNYLGISANGGSMPIAPIWPSSQDDGSRVLWQLGSVQRCAQFRSDGTLLMGNCSNPYNPPNGIASWFAQRYSSVSNLC
jgi:hypothetical protein